MSAVIDRVRQQVQPQQQRAQKVRYGAGGGIYEIRVTSAETLGTHFGFEAIEPPGGGPPLHIHRREDELFIVLEGEITFYLDGEIVTRTAGQSAFVPRGVPHCFKNGSGRTARVLVLFTPGHIEGFFEFGEPFTDGTAPGDEVIIGRIQALAPAYGLEVLGPSPL